MLLIFAFDRDSGKVCGFIECDPLVLKGIERTVSKPPLFPFHYSRNNGNCMLAAARRSIFLIVLGFGCRRIKLFHYTGID